VQALSPEEQELYDNALDMPAKFQALTEDMEAMVKESFLSEAEIATLMAEARGMLLYNCLCHYSGIFF
jgi:hypothetical protein